MAYTRNEIKELEPMVKSGKKRFVRYQESEELYSVGLHTFEQIAKEAGAIVRNEYQQGKGNVIRRMFREIDAQCYIMIDGDDTYPAEYGKQMAELVLQKKTDMVVGDRLSSTYFEENKRPFHNFGNSCFLSSTFP